MEEHFGRKWDSQRLCGSASGHLESEVESMQERGEVRRCQPVDREWSSLCVQEYNGLLYRNILAYV